jgi:hypothetical protein
VSRSSVKRLCLVLAVGVMFAAVPASASAAPTAGDWSCDIDLTVSTVTDNNDSGPLSASGSGACWIGNSPATRIPTQFSLSGSYRTKRCTLISGVIKDYMVVNGTLTMSPAGNPTVSAYTTISTYDLATANGSYGTIMLATGQTGTVSVNYDRGVSGFVARCGGGDFFPEYSGTFHQPPTNRPAVVRSTPLSGPEQSETSAGDPDGTGFASITVQPGAGRVCFNITHSNIEPTNAGHIHQGARGRNGPPVVNLYSSMGTNGTINDCFPADPVTINGLIDTPRDYYVQLHNGPYPLGVIRGQLGD